MHKYTKQQEMRIGYLRVNPKRMRVSHQTWLRLFQHNRG